MSFLRSSRSMGKWHHSPLWRRAYIHAILPSSSHILLLPLISPISPLPSNVHITHAHLFHSSLDYTGRIHRRQDRRPDRGRAQEVHVIPSRSGRSVTSSIPHRNCGRMTDDGPIDFGVRSRTGERAREVDRGYWVGGWMD